MKLDHVVLWVPDPEAALPFYTDLLGLEPVRLDAYRSGRTAFPSVRVNEATILDLMPHSILERVRAFTGAEAQTGGMPLNHVCLALERERFEAVLDSLREHDVPLTSGGEDAFGARGRARESVYAQDPAGNVVELRWYA